jgi:hypothetical protein
MFTVDVSTSFYRKTSDGNLDHIYPESGFGAQNLCSYEDAVKLLKFWYPDIETTNSGADEDGSKWWKFEWRDEHGRENPEDPAS